MNCITINASKSYNIKIGSGLLSCVDKELKALGKIQKICIVSDSVVYPLYGKDMVILLRDAGFDVISYVFPSGEESKNGQVFLELVNYLAEKKLTRSDLLVALGGGVVGDLAGFAAACFLRGIRFVQIPTTLLAAVDSSVGGKTAIDLPAGKNLCGAFYQPSLVLCDTDALKSLPTEIFRAGCAEVIKYGVLYDAQLFSYLEETCLNFNLEAVITRCVELKRDVVMEDEFDTGMRMKLNLGHTIGHGVEARSNFTISHGEAVGIGMAIISRAAVKRGMCTQSTCRKILTVLKSFGLPTTTDYCAEELYHYALSDKKRSGGTVSLIIPKEIGNCEIVPMPVSELQFMIEDGL